MKNLRKLVVAEFITIDGYIAGPTGHLDFGESVDDVDGEFEKEMISTQLQWGLLLLGHHTYDELASSWASIPIEDNPIAKFMNTVSKVVVSSRLKSAPWGKWESAKIISQNIHEEVENLKKSPGKDIAVLGSANLSQQLVEIELVDEYSFIVFPVIAGSGIPLFSKMNHDLRFKLLEVRQLKSGLLIIRYQPIKHKNTNSNIPESKNILDQRI